MHRNCLLQKGEFLIVNRSFIGSSSRYLDCGWGLPDVKQVDQGDITSAPAFTDYDAVFIDPVEISRLWTDRVATNEGGQLVIAPDQDPGLREGIFNLIDRRREEARELVRDQEGVIFSRLRPRGRPVRLNLGQKHSVHRYSWIPSHDQVEFVEEFEPYKRPGVKLDIISTQHPGAMYLRENADRIEIQGVLPSDPWQDSPMAEPIAINSLGEVAALAIDYGGGACIFLPSCAPTSEADGEKKLIRAVDRHSFCNRGAPSWIDDYEIPRAEHIQDQLSTITDEIATLQEQADELQLRLDQLTKYKKLLYARTSEELYTVAVEIFSDYGLNFHRLDNLPGFQLARAEDNRKMSVGIAVERDQPVSPEVINRFLSSIDLSEQIEDGFELGLLVNGSSKQPPHKREADVEPPFRKICKQYNISFITSTQVFELVRDVTNSEDFTEQAENLFFGFSSQP